MATDKKHSAPGMRKWIAFATYLLQGMARSKTLLQAIIGFNIASHFAICRSDAAFANEGLQECGFPLTSGTAIHEHCDQVNDQPNADWPNFHLVLNPLADDQLLVDVLKGLVEAVNGLSAGPSELETVVQKLHPITKFFHAVGINGHKYRSEILCFMNSDYGLKDMKIRPLHEKDVFWYRSSPFVVTHGTESYVLREPTQYGWGLGDLVVEHIDAPNVAKVLHVFKNTLSFFGSSLDTWHLSEHLDVDPAEYISQEKNTVDAIRKVVKDTLLGLKALHENNITYGIINLDCVRGKSEAKGDGSSEVTFKIFDFSFGKHHDNTDALKQGILTDVRFFRFVLRSIEFNIISNNDYREVTRVKSHDDENYYFSTQDEKWIDFVLVCHKECERHPQSVDDLLNHPFMTGEDLDPSNDQYGERHYSIVERF